MIHTLADGSRTRRRKNSYDSDGGARFGWYTLRSLTRARRLTTMEPVRMPFRVSEIQPTPNPNAAKFILDHPVSEQPISFFRAAEAEGYPLAQQLFAIPGVSSLLLLGDFITV